MLLTDKAFDKRELAGCDVGISDCDALVAQTGSVVVTSRSAGGRALSVLPPHHVVLARREQLVPDLPAAFALLKSKYGAGYPSMISFITGPSRTGDIERILVLRRARPEEAHDPLPLDSLLVGVNEVHKALDVIALRQPGLFLAHLQPRLHLGIVLPGIVQHPLPMGGFDRIRLLHILAAPSRRLRRP